MDKYKAALEYLEVRNGLFYFKYFSPSWNRTRNPNRPCGSYHKVKKRWHLHYTPPESSRSEGSKSILLMNRLMWLYHGKEIPEGYGVSSRDDTYRIESLYLLKNSTKKEWTDEVLNEIC